MNSRQKETLEIQIKNEKTAIRDLKKQYEKALTDINAKIRALQTDEITQSKIYQIEYQKALKGQIEAILDNLNSNQYDSISDYLNKSYEDGFIGTLYDLQGQGIPLIFPINQDQVARAIVTNSKISEGLYNKLGVDTTALKKAIRTELTRGIAQGMSYTDMARNIENQIRIGLNRAIRIARTEGHRISIESSLDAMRKAKDRGADIVKQWDATMDGRTRPHHRELDGQIRELDEPFEVAGMKVNAPHQFGRASEDVNCRCVVLQRARWAIDDEEYTKMNGETNELVHLTAKDYGSFKKQYQEAVKVVRNYDSEIAKTFGKDRWNEAQDLLDNCENQNVQSVYRQYQDSIRVGNAHNSRGAYFSPRENRIYWNVDGDSVGSNMNAKYNTFFHESGHSLDFNLNRSFGGDLFGHFSSSYNNNQFGHTIRNEVNSWVDDVNKDLRDKFKKNKYDIDWLKEHKIISTFGESRINYLVENGESLTDAIDNVVGNYSKKYAYAQIEREIRTLDDLHKQDLSDILEGATSARVQAGWGHGKKYWTYSGHLETEAFAEITSAYISNPDSLETLRKYLPETMKVYDEMMDYAMKELNK